jgi:hypothetical protein
MSETLEREILTFTPARGSFDVAAIEQQAAAAGVAFRDESRPTVFVVAASAEVRDKLQADRRAYPDEGFPFTLLIEVTPERVEVGPPYEAALVPVWRGFIAWPMRAHPCRVQNDFGTNVTEDVAKMSRASAA